MVADYFVLARNVCLRSSQRAFVSGMFSEEAGRLELDNVRLALLNCRIVSKSLYLVVADVCTADRSVATLHPPVYDQYPRS